MDKKKLIGTIIGVTMFAALIAGATYAWLSYTANIEEGTYAGQSLNFTYTYGTGTAVEGIVMAGAGPARNSLTAGKGYVVLTASKAAGTAKAQSFDIKLHKTTSTIDPESVIRYAVCKGTAAQCDNTVTTEIPTTTNSTFVEYGQLGTWDGSSDITLHSDTTTFANEGAASATYYVYLWIDGTLITSANQNSVVGQSFSGYIHASSTQTD